MLSAQELVRARETPRSPGSRDIDVRRHLAMVDQTPHTAEVHGMYIIQIYDVLQGQGIQCAHEHPLRSFRYYSVRRFMELCLNAAITLYPNEPLQSGLRRLGHQVIPTFFESTMLGKVLLGVAGKNWETALTCIARGYQISLRPGHAAVSILGPGRAQVELRSIWNFGDSYQVGIVESLMDWYSVQGHVKAHVLSQCDTDLVIEWSK